MKISNFNEFIQINENASHNSNNIINEVIVAILLAEPNFLDDTLDNGIDKYTNASTLINDIKQFMFNSQQNDNKLFLGNIKLNDHNLQIGIETDTDKINSYFNSYVKDFDNTIAIKKLKKAREIARNILDKVKNKGNKFSNDDIKYVYWLSPFKALNSDVIEDIVIELNTGDKISICVTEKLNQTSYLSMNTFMDELIGESNYSQIHIYQTDETKYNYGKIWDKTVQEFCKTILKHCNIDVKNNIGDFVDLNSIELVNWFDFFNISIQDEKYKYLGKYFNDVKKHCKTLNQYLLEVHKNSHCFHDYESYLKEWEVEKALVLKSRVIEHLINNSFKKYLNLKSEVELEKGSYKKIKGDLKLKFAKMLVKSIESEERDLHYVGSDSYSIVPEKQFFRDRYDDIDIWINYHIPVTILNDMSESEINDIPSLKVIVYLDKQVLVKLNYIIDFKSGGISESLKVKIRKDFSDKFNYQVTI